MKKITMDKVAGILFLNLETTSQEENFEKMPNQKKKCWVETYNKSSFFNEKYSSAEECFNARGSLYAEYGKIISLHMAYFDEHEGNVKLHSKVFSGKEIDILKAFCKVAKSFNKLCSYDGKKFDFPYLIKRLFINGLELPEVLETQGKKPWEIHNIETLELWQNGNTYYSSLDLVADSLGISVEKTLSGDEVNNYYYNNSSIELINLKAKTEGIANIRLWLKLNQFEELLDENIL